MTVTRRLAATGATVWTGGDGTGILQAIADACNVTISTFSTNGVTIYQGNLSTSYQNDLTIVLTDGNGNIIATIDPITTYNTYRITTPTSPASAGVSGVAPAVGLLDEAGRPLEKITPPAAQINGSGILDVYTSGADCFFDSPVAVINGSGISADLLAFVTPPVAVINAPGLVEFAGFQATAPAAQINAPGVDPYTSGADCFLTPPAAVVNVTASTSAGFEWLPAKFDVEIIPNEAQINVSALGVPHFVADLVTPAQINATGIPGHYSFVVPDNVPKAIVYKCILTGAADATTDLTLPIKSFQARLRSGNPTYLGVAVPDKDTYISQVNARLNGQLVVYKGYKFPDVGNYGGVVNYVEIARVDLEDVDWVEETNNSTINLGGHITETNTNTKSVDVSPVESVELQSDGAHRVRCAVDFFIRPGDDTVYNTLGSSFTAGLITISVNHSSESMDILEDIT